MTATTRTRDELTDQAATASIQAACRLLRLPTVSAGLEEAVATALRHQAGYKTFLAQLRAAECDERETRRKIRAVKAAVFPRIKRVEEFDFTANPNITPAVVHTLAAGAWIREGRPLCLIGDSGTGKSTHLRAPTDPGAELRAVEEP